MRKSVTRKTIKQNSQKTVRNEANNQTELTENSAQGTNVQNNQTELTENSAQCKKVTKNLPELKKRCARN